MKYSKSCLNKGLLLEVQYDSNKWDKLKEIRKHNVTLKTDTNKK